MSDIALSLYKTLERLGLISQKEFIKPTMKTVCLAVFIDTESNSPYPPSQKNYNMWVLFSIYNIIFIIYAYIRK